MGWLKLLTVAHEVDISEMLAAIHRAYGNPLPLPQGMTLTSPEYWRLRQMTPKEAYLLSAIYSKGMSIESILELIAERPLSIRALSALSSLCRDLDVIVDQETLAELEDLLPHGTARILQPSSEPGRADAWLLRVGR